MKQKLLLLHGALGSKNQFKGLKEKLGDSYDLYPLNFEGHGGQESSNDFSIALFTKNVLDFIDESAIDKVTVFGYSMGGYVALNAALQLPAKIKKIITLGTKFNWTLESAQKEVRMLNPIKIEEKVPHFAEKLRQEHHPSDWKRVMKKTANMMINMAQGAKLSDTDFKHIQQEIVIGVGSLDTMVSYSESEYISGLLPNSKLVKLEGVKHPIEQIPIDKLVHYIQSN